MASNMLMTVELVNCSSCGATVLPEEYVKREGFAICDKCAVTLGYIDALTEETKLLRKTKRTGFRRATKIGVFQKE